MLDDLGAFEQGAEPYSVLYKITLKLLEEQGEKQPTGGNIISQMQRDEALLRQCLAAMENPDGIDEYNRSISDNAIAALKERLG
jgi:hypothetical protein